MKDKRLFNSFVKYCQSEKAQGKTFWQCLAGWSGRFIFQANYPFELKRLHDTWKLRGRHFA